MLKQKFRRFDNFVFDLDGTVWKWIKLIHGTRDVFKELYRLNKSVYFISNNAAFPRKFYIKYLHRFGIEAELSQFSNPTLVAISLLKKKKVLCIGYGLKKDMESAGIRIVKTNPDAVVAADAPHLSLSDIKNASQAIKRGAKFYKTASGGVWAMWGNKVPGAGGISTIMELLTRKEGTLIGKPSKYMVKEVKKWKLNPKKTIMFGDEINSDIVFANKINFTSAFVLSGRDSMRDVPAYDGSKPDLILNSIANILE